MKFEDLLYILSTTKDKKAQSIIIKQLHYLDDAGADKLARLQYDALGDYDDLLNQVLDIRDGDKTAEQVLSWGIGREQDILDGIEDIKNVYL